MDGNGLWNPLDAFGILWMPLDTGIFARERKDSEAPHIGPVWRAKISGGWHGRTTSHWDIAPDVLHPPSPGFAWWLIVTCIELRRGSKMWRLSDSKLVSGGSLCHKWIQNAPKLMIPQIHQQLAKCDIPKQEISRSSFDSLHWSICHARSTAPNPSGRGTSLQYHILIWGTYHYHMEGYFWGMFCFFLFSSLASVAFVGVWPLWLYHALPIYLSNLT